MSNEFSFMEVGKVEVEQLPTLIKNDVYKNQDHLFNMANIKDQTGLFIGCGSVGSNTIKTMNKFGFSSFQVYDYDIWEPHNSASSVFDYYIAEKEFQMSSRSYQSWTYYPNNTVGRDSPSHSAFKVDLLNKQLKGNDRQMHFEPFRVPYGIPYEQAMSMFYNSLTKLNARKMFNSDGIRSSTFNSNEMTEIDVMSDYTPNYMVLTIDNLLGRLRSVNMIKQMLITEYEYTNIFPIIDGRTLDTVKGEIYLFDLFNDSDYLKWINTMLSPKDHFETLTDYESLINEKEENWDLIKTLDINIVNVCGDKMSTIISQQMAISITNLLGNIFREKDKVNLEGLPKESYINTSMFKPYYACSKEFVDV